MIALFGPSTQPVRPAPSPLLLAILAAQITLVYAEGSK